MKGRLLTAIPAFLLLAACSSTSSPTASANVSPTTAGSSGLPPACLDEATVGAAAGFAVTVERATIKQSQDAVNCTFLAADQQARPGANVSLLVAPAAFADQALADITANAGRAQTSTVPVPLGSNGLAYASSQRTAAATVVGGKLVGVTIDGMGLSSPNVKAEAAIGLLGKVAAKVGG